MALIKQVLEILHIINNIGDRNIHLTLKGEETLTLQYAPRRTYPLSSTERKLQKSNHEK